MGMNRWRTKVTKHMTSTMSRAGHASTPTSSVLTNHVATPVPTRPVASTWMPTTIMMTSQGMLS